MAINYSLTGLEFLSVLFNTIFVFGIANQKIWAWLSGFIGCFLAVFLFLFDALYAEAFLNIFYSGLAIYGWLRWRNASNAPKLRRLEKDFRISIDQISSIPLILIFALISGYMMDLSTNNPLPYTDCVIAALSILATIWQACRIWEQVKERHGRRVLRRRRRWSHHRLRARPRCLARHSHIGRSHHGC